MEDYEKLNLAREVELNGNAYIITSPIVGTLSQVLWMLD